MHTHITDKTRWPHRTPKLRPQTLQPTHKHRTTRACGYAQRDALLCEPACAHIHSHSHMQGPTGAGRKAKLALCAVLVFPARPGPGFSHRGPQAQAALNSPQQSEGAVSPDRELTCSLRLGWTCQPTSQLLPLLGQLQQGSDSPMGQWPGNPAGRGGKAGVGYEAGLGPTLP